MAIGEQIDESTQKYLAYVGLIQWTHSIIIQRHLILEAESEVERNFGDPQKSQQQRLLAQLRTHTLDHQFAAAAHQLLDHKEWAQQLALFETVDFSEINRFPRDTIRDLRNMREHQVEYFLGKGRAKDRWITESAGGDNIQWQADASSRVNNLIGGRLDYVEFTNAASRLLDQLINVPAPY
jgi:hypothetical protein